MEFLFHLADRRGCSVHTLLANTDAREIKYWQAYYLRHQWGAEREDRRAAIGIYLTALAAAGRLDTKKLTPDRIMLFLNPAATEKKKGDTRRIHAHFQMLAMASAVQKSGG